MDWTILQPTPVRLEHHAVDGRDPWAPACTGALRRYRASTIHPADIASVARVALTEPSRGGQRYALTGPEQVTARQQVAIPATELGREIEFAEIRREQARSKWWPPSAKRPRMRYRM